MGICDTGILTPLPPCFACDCFVAVAENQPCCRCIGRCGYKKYEKQPLRARIMLTAAFLSFAALLMQLVPVISLSTDEDVIMATAWSTFDVESTLTNISSGAVRTGVKWDGFVSPNGVVLETNEDTFFIDWDDVEYCNDGYFDNCDECRDAAEGTFTVAILSFVTAIPQFTTDLQRSHLDGDVNCQRLFGMLTGMAGFFSGISSAVTYIQACGEGFPDEGRTVVNGVAIDSEFSHTLGPSAILLLVASLMKLIDVAIHCLVPVPEVTCMTKRSDKAHFAAEVDPIHTTKEP